MKLNKTLLVDGSYMLHRSLHIPSVFNLTNNKGERTGGIFQFVRSLQYEIRKHGSYYPVVCWDAGLAERRLELLDNYKKHKDNQYKPDPKELSGEEKREREEEMEYLSEYRKQRSEIIEFLSYVGIPSLRRQGWEGDDLLYIISRQCKESIIVTDDKDLLQLLSDNVYVSRPIADEIWSLDNFLEDRGFDSIEVFVYKKAIQGDRSDNIPQVAKGVGEVNAERIAKKIYSIGINNQEEYLAELAEGNTLDQRFVENHSKFLRNLRLIDLSYVNIPTNLLDVIDNEVSQSIGNIDYFGALGFLSEKGITDLDLDGIISNLNRLISENDLN